MFRKYIVRLKVCQVLKGKKMIFFRKTCGFAEILAVSSVKMASGVENKVKSTVIYFTFTGESEEFFSFP